MGAALGEIIGEVLLDGRPAGSLNQDEQDAIVNKTKLIVGSVAALTGGNVNMAANTAETAVRNNAFFVPVWYILGALAATYTTAVGQGDTLAGLEIIGRGEDPLSKAINSGVDSAVTLSMETYPEQTMLVLKHLDQFGKNVDVVVNYLDDKTGKVVSSQWNKLEQSTRNKLLGAGKVVDMTLLATTVSKIRIKIKESNIPKTDPQLNALAKERLVLEKLANNQNKVTTLNKTEMAVYNSYAVKKLKQGVLPGDGLDLKTGAVVPNKTGVPRQMPSSSDPDAMALDFVEKLMGRKSTRADFETEASKKLLAGKCKGCFSVEITKNEFVIYRPAGNSGIKTDMDTATVEFKSPLIDKININNSQKSKQLKLKFPKSK